MRHHLFEEANSYSVALLIKSTCFTKQELINTYLNPLVDQGVLANEVIAFTLSYTDHDKAPVGHIKDYLANLLPALDSLHVKYLYVADAAYFKVLTGKTKADPNFGYVLPCKIKGYEHMHVVLGINYRALIFNPDLQPKLDQSLRALVTHRNGIYVPPGDGIIHIAQYPRNIEEITAALTDLLTVSSLTCDIEGFSLDFDKAGIGTIAFGFNQHNGVAFACDYAPLSSPNSGHMLNGEFGQYVPNLEVRALLRTFFETYTGELTFHGASYDVKVLIANLWMKDLLDTEGLLTGLNVLSRAFHDTKIIAYLATNSTAGNVLGLKALAHEFAGNWAVEVNDIRTVPLNKLLQYNLIDALCTHYVRSKYEPIMQADKQEDLYHDLMLPSLKLIIQLELTGMPLNAARVQAVKAELTQIQQTHLNTVLASPTVHNVNRLLQVEAQTKANAKLKIKQHPLSKFADKVLNPNSSQQLQKLLYEEMGLPVLDYTDTKQPACGGETIEKLINHTQDPDHKAVLQALISYGQANKVLSTFIPAFERALKKDDTGIVWLHGSFNLNGTVSGRLSSSDPNLHNIPANSIYGKLIKTCFMGPTGWLFCGADFNSLEDYISALTTKDPNKIRVYTEGFDGHCLRAAFYFSDRLRDIELAPDQAQCYKAKVGGTDIYFHSEEDVEYLGQQFKGRELHALLTNQGL